MVYSTASDVRSLVNTSLSDEEITEVIETSDAYIDRKIGAQDPSDRLIKRLSMLLTAKAIKTRYPLKVTAIGYSESSVEVLEVWRKEINDIFKLYKGVSIKASEYRHIDEETRYPET